MPLVIVLSQEKSLLANGTSTRQMFNMQAHVTPPTSPTSYPVNVSLGKLNVVLILEDLGPILLTDDHAAAKTGVTSENGVSGISHQFTPLKSYDGNAEGTDLGHSTSMRDHVASVEEHVASMKGRMTTLRSHMTDPGNGGTGPGGGGKLRDRQDEVVGRKGLGSAGNIKESSEYEVAMELETWKLAEEEAFKVSPF